MTEREMKELDDWLVTERERKRESETERQRESYPIKRKRERQTERDKGRERERERMRQKDSLSLLPPPRILKHDIRRQYPRMLVNTINSFSLSLLLSFHAQLTTPSFTMIMSSSSPYFNFSLSLSERERVLAYWSGLMQLSPDHVLEIDRESASAVRIVTDNMSRGRCRVMFDFRVRGRQMYRLSPAEMVSEMERDFERVSLRERERETEREKETEREIERETETERERESMTHSERETEREIARVMGRDGVDASMVRASKFDVFECYRRTHNGAMPPIQPMDLDVRGTYVIHVNEENLIDLIEVQGVMK
jgi:hypothetical protein